MAASFAAGLVFAVGLGLSGMTQPAKVLAFLDVAGIATRTWDPSLAFVMGGAILVHVFFARRAANGAAPLLASYDELPAPGAMNAKGAKGAIDWRLLVGAALFGIGWGLAGFCPGPALVSTVTLAPATLAFVAAMLAGMFLQGALFGPRGGPITREPGRPRSSGPAPAE